MIILGTNSVKAAGGFDVANSARFDNAGDDSLTRSKGSETSLRKGTFSWWMKRAETEGTAMLVYSNETTSDSNRAYIEVNANENFRVLSSEGNDQQILLVTDAEFRDFSAWTNFVVSVDTTQGTASNRVKIYINGVLQTSFSTSTYPGQNADLILFKGGQTNKEHIGKINGESPKLSGYLSEFVFVDGLQLAADQFGEFDEDSGIWKPIDVSGLTFGNNGFYLDFEASGNLGNDANGGTDFTETNLAATDQSTDTCTNNFATFNPLITTQSNTLPVFSEGNLKSTFDNGSTNEFALSTFAVSSGKWYAEFKWVAATGGGTTSVGIVKTDANFNQDVNDNGISYKGNGQKNIGGSSSSYGASYGTGNIISIALNMNDNQVTFYKDGASQGAISITANLTYFMFCTDYNNKSADANFGSPPYAISSGNTDGNGYGNFEYAVPSGYYSLNTKNLAEYG